jgi:hypothetical protein
VDKSGEMRNRAFERFSCPKENALPSPRAKHCSRSMEKMGPDNQRPVRFYSHNSSVCHCSEKALFYTVSLMYF